MRNAANTRGNVPGRPRVRLVVNADDFGRSEAINTAVLEAHREGILTSASLMVTAPAAADAVRIAQANPNLAVGLHLVVLGGRSALPPQEIPHLVNSAGLFSRNAFWAGLRYFFLPKVRAELAREIRAQFEAFRQTGLRLSHVDGHHHMHLHPTVLRLLLPLASEFGASAVRVAVADELLFSLRFDRSHLLLKLAWKLAFAPLCRHAGRVAKRHGMSGANRVYGLMQSGQLRERYLVALLQRLAEKANGRGKSRGAGKLKAPEETGGQALKEQPLQTPGPVIEIFCHPSLRQESSDLGPNPGDLAALLSPAVRERLTAHGLLLTTYPECMPAQATRQVPQASGAPGPEG